MGFFNLFKKNKKGENKMSTLDEVRKAYEDLSEEDKKSFHQSLSDRVHESIAAQERADGNENSQSAEAREHEALGAEHADGKGDVNELHENDDTKKEKEQDKHDDEQDAKHEKHGEDIAELKKMFEERFAKVEERLEKMSGQKMENAREKYGLSSKGGTENTKAKFTDEDVDKLLGK